MKTQRISWILALQAVVLLGLGFIFEQQLEQQLIKDHHSDSTQILHLIASEAALHAAQPNVDYDALADRLGSDSNARVTLINPQGVVLGDSGLSPQAIAHLDNHAQRPEIDQALDGDIGYGERHSGTLDESMHYLATLSQDGSLVVRIAFNSRHLQAAINKLRLLVVLLCVLLLTVVGSLWFYSLQFVSRSVKKEKSRLEQELDDHHNKLQTLQSVGEMLGACVSLREVGDVIESYFRQLLGEHSGVLMVMRSSRDRLEPVAQWGATELAHAFSPNECWALRLGHTHLDNNQDQPQHCGHRLKQDTKTQGLCIPLAARGEILGSLNLELPACWKGDSEHLAFCKSVTKQVSLTLANIQLNDSLRQQAIRDALTGLYNRRYLTESLESEINRSQRHGSPLSLLMLDLDHFKRINDRFGHETGDKALRAFALNLQRNCRREDFPCRYGGEEFCVLLPETNQDKGMAVAEKLRKATCQIDVRSPTGELIPLTVSIGLACWNEQLHNLDALVSAADEALYQAKSEGRNRVVLAEPPDTTAHISLDTL